MTNLIYLFDPLCGWCYGASACLTQLQQQNISLRLMPTGLFSHSGRMMDKQFADYAWQNDQRIYQITKQPFSQKYRQHVLNDEQQAFDSWQATLALTSVSMTNPEDEFSTLKAIQQARYVDGKNITNPQQLQQILSSLGLTQSVELWQNNPDTISQQAQQRIALAQRLLQQYNLSGVPQLILEKNNQQQLLPNQLLFGDVEKLLEWIK